MAAEGERFGFGALRPVELVDVEFQIAQKIHAVTDPSYVRAHDLVDLQLLWNADPDLFAVCDFCVRTFDWCRAQDWPPLPLRPMAGWELAYGEAREETAVDKHTLVLPDVASAREWFERTIESIEATGSR